MTVTHSPSYDTVEERAQRGKNARKRVPRADQAQYDPPADRPDPIALLEEQAATRVPDLVPIRYGRMVESAFPFYRGAALIMASDLSTTPDSGLTVQACGDAHLANFGAFGSPERDLVFDTNDFDETNPGPWEWDLKRLVTSLEVAARSRGFDDAVRKNLLVSTTQQYRQSMATFAGMTNLDIWYSRLDVQSILAQFQGSVSTKIEKRARRSATKARSRDSMQALNKFTAVVDGELRIVSDPPLIIGVRDMAARSGVNTDEIWNLIESVLGRYRRTLNTDRRHLLDRYRLIDVARKVVGVGSVGTRAWMVLMLGRDNNDPLFLQVKEAQASVLERFTTKSVYDNSGERVVAGQRLMQSASDIFLGWDRIQGVDGIQRDYYLRQLRDWKGSAEIDVMEPEALVAYGRMCAWTLAKAHARSGDAIAISAYCGKNDVLDRAIADFAEAYADQNDRDHAALVAAVDSGRVTAERGI
ncbi:MAG: DUF2252 domain-containing protein [Candidatus Nanopelagicales bacterium]